MDDFILEQKIKGTLEKKAESACADTCALQRIQTKVYSRIKEAEHMKHKNWKKTAVVAAAICVLGSMTVLGLGRAVTITSGSNPADAIQTYVAAEKKQESLDKHVKMVENFSNGYAFKMAIPREETAHDEGGNVVGKETTLQIVYGKENAEDVYVYSGRLSIGLTENPDVVRTLEDGTELLFSSLVNKVVADSYVITDEEKELQESGKLNIAYDGRKDSKVDIHTSSHVTWTQDDIVYSMMAIESGLTAEELLNMAQEIAESES